MAQQIATRDGPSVDYDSAHFFIAVTGRFAIDNGFGNVRIGSKNGFNFGRFYAVAANFNKRAFPAYDKHVAVGIGSAQISSVDIAAAAIGILCEIFLPRTLHSIIVENYFPDTIGWRGLLIASRITMGNGP